MPNIVKVEADIKVSTQGGVLSFDIVGTGSGVHSLADLGSYIGTRVDDELRKLLGVNGSPPKASPSPQPQPSQPKLPSPRKA